MKVEEITELIVQEHLLALVGKAHGGRAGSLVHTLVGPVRVCRSSLDHLRLRGRNPKASDQSSLRHSILGPGKRHEVYEDN
jgi:hypothetical protein